MDATINDVAKLAGVSITTVSRVLNNNYPVKQETREKILKAIQELNYNPNLTARSLITKKSYSIAVLVPSITNLFFPTVVEAIEIELKSKGYSVFLSTSLGNPEEEKKQINNIVSKQVDGIIIIDPTEENLKNGFFEEVDKRAPVIIVNSGPLNYNLNFVCYDEEVGAGEALKYLYSLGHKKIAFIRGENSSSYDVREAIYENFLKLHKLKYNKIINVGDGNSNTTSFNTELIMDNFLEEEELPTAIFCCNDIMAVGAINGCIKNSFKVPEDISVIGFDNTILANVLSPRITSVDLKMSEIGSQSAKEMLDIIKNKDKIKRKMIIKTRLIKRESTGRAKN